VVIEDHDYCYTIISSLPAHLSNFASSLLAGVRLYSDKKTIDPDTLIALISEESECNGSHCSCARKSSREAKDEAMMASSNDKEMRKLKVC